MNFLKEYKLHGVAINKSRDNFSSAGRVSFNSGYARGIRVLPSGQFGNVTVRDCFAQEGYLYQELTIDGIITGNNNPVSLIGYKEIIMQAYGSILLSNVKSGALLYRLLRKQNVDFVTIAESNLNLVKLLQDSFEDFSEKLTFVNCEIEDVVNTFVYDLIIP
ncbi:MAG: hypothetical protein JXR91_04250 [Deltaproteobacteria bacterium]|nr:hypothetical protein [Deltaproteobacteria bacterium]